MFFVFIFGVAVVVVVAVWLDFPKNVNKLPCLKLLFVILALILLELVPLPAVVFFPPFSFAMI